MARQLQSGMHNITMASVPISSSVESARVGDDARVRTATILALVQGFYFLLTGVWPLVSIRTFQLVTGFKTDNHTGRAGDHWLVMTVGVLVTAIALTLLFAAWRRDVRVQTVVLAVGSSLGLTAIDVIYVARGVIDRIYLLDAGIEVVLIAAWMFAIGSGRLALQDRAVRA
jgi:uncharacterized membrane protein YjjB (DUF3815 family)